MHNGFDLESWERGYAAGFEAGRKVEGDLEAEGRRDAAAFRSARPTSATASNWDYEGLGGYGSQER